MKFMTYRVSWWIPPPEIRDFEDSFEIEDSNSSIIEITPSPRFVRVTAICDRTGEVESELKTSSILGKSSVMDW